MAQHSSAAVGWQQLTGARHVSGAAAALLGFAAVVETLVRGAGSGVFGLVVLVCLIALATSLPVALPGVTTAAVAVVTAGAGSLGVFGLLTVAGGVAQTTAVYRLGRCGRPEVAVGVGAPYFLVALLADGPAAVVALVLAGLLPAIALAGLAARMRREDAESRAARRAAAGTLAEHTAAAERVRIARELHDVVAHHISMVVVQAENTRLTTPGLPAVGAARLSDIGDTARAALTEMRRLLGVLREDAGVDTGDRRPQPALSQLGELLDEARDAAGACTRLILRGSPVPLDPGIELAAYRIVQEALTNARRHAPGAAVDVDVDYTGACLRLLVRDNGPGPGCPPMAGARGLLGMRERAAAVGGWVRVGPANVGGFLVEAVLPTGGGERP